MKGFIEVTDNQGYTYLININKIQYLGCCGMLVTEGVRITQTKETYEEIKQLIKNATEI